MHTFVRQKPKFSTIITREVKPIRRNGLIWRIVFRVETLSWRAERLRGPLGWQDQSLIPGAAKKRNGGIPTHVRKAVNELIEQYT